MFMQMSVNFLQRNFGLVSNLSSHQGRIPWQKRISGRDMCKVKDIKVTSALISIVAYLAVKILLCPLLTQVDHRVHHSSSQGEQSRF